MQIQFLEKPENLLETGLRRARKEAEKISLGKKKEAKKKEREIRAVSVAGNYVQEKLWNAVKEFPSIDALNPFYAELFPAIIDVAEAKKAVAQINASARVIAKIQKETIFRMKRTSKKGFSFLQKAKKSFFGRMASVVKGLEKSTQAYNETARKLKELPKIDTEAKTVILAGYPNTGKTTILKRLTGAKGKIASYPFTTTQLNLGYFEYRHARIQVIDTPGLLDKQAEKRNAIETKAIAALRHLGNAIVFVADAGMHSGYPLLKQKKLFEEMEKMFQGKKILLVFNKSDITGIAETEKAQQEFGRKAIIEGEGRESRLKEEIGKALM